MTSEPDLASPAARALARRFESWGADAAQIPSLVARVLRAQGGPSAPASALELGARQVWLRALYDAHLDALLRYVTAKVASAADAEEVAHDVFLEAYEKFDAYRRDVAAPRTWLFCLARGRASNRARSVRRRSLHEEARPEVADAGSVAGRDDRSDIQRAVDQLPDDLREVWWLCRIEELTQVEVATVLEIPEGTVATRMRRADALLREALQDRVVAPVAVPVALAGSDALESLIRRGTEQLRQAPPVTPARRERLWQEIERDVNRRVPPPPGASLARPRGRAALTHALTLALGVVLGVALRPPPRAPPPAVLPVVAPLAREADPSPTPSSNTSRTTEALESTPAEPVAAALPPPSPPPPGATAEAPHARAPVPRAPVGEDDLGYHLRRARAALQRGAARDAQSALDMAERALQPGDNREYLDSLRIEACVLGGETDRAGRLLDAFRTRYPQSAHLGRLERWVAGR